MPHTDQTLERLAYFKAGAHLFGTYAFCAGFVLTVLVSLLSVLFHASVESACFMVAGAWVAALGVAHFAVLFKAPNVADREIQQDRF